jgi:hypothetical protein
MNLLEREETDFVDQVKKSKAFIQSVIRQEIYFIKNLNINKLVESPKNNTLAVLYPPPPPLHILLQYKSSIGMGGGITLPIF